MFIAETDYTLSVPRFAEEFGRLLRGVEKAASGNGIGVAEGRVLVAMLGGDASPSQLVRKLDLDSGQLTRVVDRLEKKDLVSREHRAGRSRTILVLTPAGSRRALQLQARQRDEALRIFGSTSEHERERFLASLKHLGEHLYLGNAEPLVRDAAPGETGLLVYRAVESFCAGTFPYDGSLEQRLSRGFANLLEMPHFILVAERQRGLGGAIAVEIDKAAQRASIRFLSVFRYEQGRGLGSHLLHEATERARSLGLTTMSAELPGSDYGPSFLTKFGAWTRHETKQKDFCGRRVQWERWSRRLSSARS